MKTPKPVTVELTNGEILRHLLGMPEGDPNCRECGGSGWIVDQLSDDPDDYQVGRCSVCMPPSLSVVDGKLVPGTLEHFEKVDGKWIPKAR